MSTDKTNVVEDSNKNTVEMAGIEPASECCPPSESLERGSCSCQDNCDRSCPGECCPPCPCPPCPPNECPTRGISWADVMQSLKEIKK